MLNGLKISFIGILSVVFFSCVHDDVDNYPQTGNTWTFIAYLDGDNDLADDLLSDMAEMKAGALSADIRVLALLDLPDGRTAKRYEIRQGVQTQLADIGELDMAAPETLTDFLVWAKQQIDQPTHTVLLLADHGNGWDQLVGPSPPETPLSQKTAARSMFVDWDNGSRRAMMLNHMIREAIEAADLSIDILALDASIMGTIEAIYEFANLAPLIISSQEVGYRDGWDYEYILKQLSKNTSITREAFSSLVVDSYERYFEQVVYPSGIEADDQRFTIATHRSDLIQQIAAAVEQLSIRLTTELNDETLQVDSMAKLSNARDSAEKIDRYIQPYVYVDLKDFVTKLGLTSEIPRLIDQATVASYSGKDRPNANGLSIVFYQFPNAYGLTYDSNYKNWDALSLTGNRGAFLNEFQWDEMLQVYYQAAFPELEL